MKHALGVDIGGTKISMVLGNEHGKILAQKIIPTLTGGKTSESVRAMTQALGQMKKEFKGRLSGVGIGIPGPVDSASGIVPRSPNLSGWQGLQLRKILQKNLGLPVRMGNDANAAALGEKIFGQGRGLKNFIYVTVSTGIGGGIVSEGKLLEGVSYVAGEVGHMKLVPQGELCKCGGRGCFEAYASGTAIARMAGEEYRKRGKSAALRKLAGGEPLAAWHVGLAARGGDKIALEVYKKAGAYLGTGLANLLNILNPEMIILGGGVWNSAPPEFWKTMLRTCSRDAWPQAMKAVKIVRSNLKGHAGDLGALALGFETCA